MPAMSLSPELRLPWESTAEDDRRFLKLLRNMLLAFGALAVAVPLLPVPDVSREKLKETTPELVQVTLEEKALPEPVKPPPKHMEKVPEPPAPVQRVKEKPREHPGPGDQLARAREVAAVSGLLAFRDDLSEMRDTVDVNALNQAQTRRGQESAATTERSIVTSGLPANSGGITTSSLSRDTGGPALSGRETTRVRSELAGTAGNAGKNRSAKPGGRSDEAIRRIMDQNKGAIFAIYNRALRKDPLLRGRVVFEMVIEPSGGVARLVLVSSELSDPALTSRILSRIKLIEFGAENVDSTLVNYSLDFLPYS
ncbi:MAG: AgmX/PglI C-terminal domain-containing protein [Gammaproteobacteria bacterium]|jgi:protein TonB|nr:AgmX/PglI C-terminal domain-containing protein [Gammaproteobacteria bacterium]MDH5171545.1 AgmX/PglI C-terminal domain-containing protein [Gammaproteobacteria bacterium]